MRDPGRGHRGHYDPLHHYKSGRRRQSQCHQHSAESGGAWPVHLRRYAGKEGQWRPSRLRLFRSSRISRLRSISRLRLSRISPGGLRSARVPESLFPDPAASAGRAVYRRASAAGPAGTAGADRSPARVLPLPAAPKPAARASVRTAAQPCAKVPLPYGKQTDTQTTL